MQKHSSNTSNTSLKTVAGMENYPGTPLDQKGCFMNEEFAFWPSTKDVIKWKFVDSNPYKEAKNADLERVEVNSHASLDEIADNSITWLGHASFLIQLDGI